MHRYAAAFLILLGSIIYVPVITLAADLGPSSADLWNILQCIPFPWTPQGTNPAEEIFLKGLTQPNFREWTVQGGGWSFEELKKASEEAALSCKLGPDGIERTSTTNPSSGDNDLQDHHQLQHPSEYKIDTSSAAYQKYLRELASIAYSIACFHGPHKHEPGFSQRCKEQVARFYGRTPARLQRGQIERLRSNICARRQRLESSRTSRPGMLHTKEGADFWRFIQARHCGAERALANWLRDDWLPQEGDERARNARWYHNRRYEEEQQPNRAESNKEDQPMPFVDKLGETLGTSPYLPWNRGRSSGAGTPLRKSPARGPIRKPFKA